MIRAIDFFCGAGGMSFGLASSGIEIIAGIDHDKKNRLTYEANIPGAVFIESDVRKMRAESLAKIAGIRRLDDDLAFIACGPCQYWTNMRTIKSKASSTKNLLWSFKRFVEHYLPGYIVIENVPGIMRNGIESKLRRFIKILSSLQYQLAYGVLNTANFQVPQNRHRFILIASRINNNIGLPLAKQQPSHVRNVLGVNNGFATISPGHHDDSPFLHTTAKLAPINMQRLEMTPIDGGDRLSWKDIKSLQLKAYIDKDNTYKDTYGRLFWDKPAPTITTKFYSISNGRFAHPEENRGLSLREGATLQSFPKDYTFHGTGIGDIARQIGNAVPPALARHIGLRIIQISSNK
ncbi:DNA cytosine methyltransferase [Chloroflexota bacterium]